MKTAIVTGGTRGIGYGITQKLLEHGWNVAIIARSVDDFTVDKKYEYKWIFDSADLTSELSARKAIEKICSQFPKVDLVVCNVGDGRSVSVGDESYDEWIRVLNVNLLSTTNTVESVFKHLNKDNSSIICISSICGVSIIEGAPITYSVAKSALNTYVRYYAKYLAKFNVRINAIAPGNILFNGSVWDTKMKNNKCIVEKMIHDNVPLRKFGDINDIADMVEYLSSEKAKFITGSIITIDGGQVK